MNYIELALIVGSVVVSGLFGYTVLDNLRMLRSVEGDARYKLAIEHKWKVAGAGFGLAMVELFWPAAIIWLDSGVGTEEFRGWVFVGVWLCGRGVLLWLWWRIQ